MKYLCSNCRMSILNEWEGNNTVKCVYCGHTFDKSLVVEERLDSHTLIVNGAVITLEETCNVHERRHQKNRAAKRKIMVC